MISRDLTGRMKTLSKLMLGMLIFTCNAQAQDYEKYEETCYINGENTANYVGTNMFIQYEIYKHWDWQNNGQRLVAEVTFDVDLEGKTFKARISKSSGNEEYDQSAVRAIENASPIRAQNPIHPHRGALFFSAYCYYVKDAKMIFDSRIFDAKSPLKTFEMVPENVVRQREKGSAANDALPKELENYLDGLK